MIWTFWKTKYFFIFLKNPNIQILYFLKNQDKSIVPSTSKRFAYKKFFSSQFLWVYNFTGDRHENDVLHRQEFQPPAEQVEIPQGYRHHAHVNSALDPSL